MTDDAPGPRFDHDCSSCVFLGHHTIDDVSIDLYVCPPVGPCHWTGSALARYSSDPPDYSSVPIDITGDTGLVVDLEVERPEMPEVEAIRRARTRGVLRERGAGPRKRSSAHQMKPNPRPMPASDE